MEEGIETALIMEDDMDWDVRVKPQLEIIAAGARSIMSNLPDALFPPAHPRHTRSISRTHVPFSPYGDDWDILWLRHCGELFPETLDESKNLADGDPARLIMQRKYTVLNDATVPPFHSLTGVLNFTAYPEHTRWVHITGSPICSFAYALTQRGARKVLYDLSISHLTGPFDNALGRLCQRAVGDWSPMLPGSSSAGPREQPKSEYDGLNTKCLSVTPPVFFHHKAKGLVSGDSDIQAIEKDPEPEESSGTSTESKVREKGTTENIMWSARLNLQNMIMETQMEAQF